MVTKIRVGLALVLLAILAIFVACEGSAEPDTDEKPVIYLYPEHAMQVEVGLDLTDAELTFTYPDHGAGGWSVWAEPDGTLTDAAGRSYPSLFWEATTAWPIDEAAGSVVSRRDVVAFLEESLAVVGLNDREAAEFIQYWGPRLTSHPYVFLHFATEDEYGSKAKLDVSPAPDAVIRVQLVWEGLDRPRTATAQNLSELAGPERTGFTVVEWGGTELR